MIDWFDWGSDAFERAKTENKLVLLDIYGTWCHWCMRMDKDTYEHALVIDLIGRNFIPVRVDTDKRPDVNARYNVGGWPSTVVLTPDGDTIAGATYLPPDEMLSFLTKIDELWKKNRDALKEHVTKPQEATLPKGRTENVVELYRSWLEELYDNEHGGFGREPKFPQPHLFGLLFLLCEDGRGWKDRTEMTLQRMAALADREGGFFRYATKRDWSAPHYEKMLGDNALLVNAYLRGYALFGKSAFLETAKRTLDWMMTLYGDGYFYGSQAADEDYYKKRARAKPPVDKTLYADRNCAAAAALLKASVILNDDSYKKTALDVLTNVLEKCFDGERVYHYVPRGPATLTDAVALAEACIEAYEHTLDEEWLTRAVDVVEALISSFGSSGAFYDIATTEEHGLMSVKHKSAQENGNACRVLLKLHALTEEEKYMDLYKNVVSELAGLVEGKSVFAPQYAESLLYGKKGVAVVTLTGEAEQLQKSVLSKLSDRILVKKGEGNKTEALVCLKDKCLGPYKEASQLLEALEKCA